MQTISYLSLFSGIGGFELGFEKSRYQQSETTPNQTVFQSAGYCEIDPVATKIYQHHFPDHKAFGDLRPESPPAIWRIRRFVFDLMRPVFAISFSWQIRRA